VYKQPPELNTEFDPGSTTAYYWHEGSYILRPSLSSHTDTHRGIHAGFALKCKILISMSFGMFNPVYKLLFITLIKTTEVYYT